MTTLNQLETCCEECAEEKPLTIIRNRVMLEAKRLLLFTQLKSKEIAYNLGFAEQAHFVNYFKKNTGITPTAFRKKYGEDANSL